MEQIEEPAFCVLFTSSSCGRRGVSSGILAPSAGEPIGGNTNRVRGAYHPSVEARPCHSSESGLSQIDQFLNDRCPVLAFLGKFAFEGFAHLLIGLFRPLWSFLQTSAKTNCTGNRRSEGFFVLISPS